MSISMHRPFHRSSHEAHTRALKTPCCQFSSTWLWWLLQRLHPICSHAKEFHIDRERHCMSIAGAIYEITATRSENKCIFAHLQETGTYLTISPGAHLYRKSNTRIGQVTPRCSIGVVGLRQSGVRCSLILSLAPCGCCHVYVRQMNMRCGPASGDQRGYCL